MAWKPFSSKIERSIVEAIQRAEDTCSGEIRVHLDRYCKGDPVFKAKNLFFHLEMEKTKQRNGVLIYAAIKDRKFSIIGDEGIDAKVPDDFWETTKELMLAKFAQGDIPGGLVVGIEHAGEQLSTYFPSDEDKGNELTDDISYGA
ncbi:MAG: TPM domain-containing protein [Bacteroidia bacterium]|nr:TPM domain-containing protein [Bacteroidia bacterium]